MALNFRLSDQNLSAEDFDTLVRTLPVDAAGEGIAIELLEESGSSAGAVGRRGDPVTIGAFALALVTSGSIVALFNLLKSYLERSEELTVEFVGQDGLPVKLQMKNVSLDKFKSVIRELGEANG